MDHIVIPLRTDHVMAVERLSADAARAAGLPRDSYRPTAHITLLAYTGLDRATVRKETDGLVATMHPFTVHAHGYGIFTGDHPSDLSLHVPIVRTVPLDSLHQRLWTVLRQAGAEMATWTDAEVWSPHITLLDRSLDPSRLGAAVAWLARRRHPSWRILVDRVSLTGGWRDHDHPGELLLLGSVPPAVVSRERGPFGPATCGSRDAGWRRRQR